MANRTLNTGNSLYSNLAFCLDGQSDAQDLITSASSWSPSAPSKNGNAFRMTGQALTTDITTTGPISLYVKFKIISYPAGGAGPAPAWFGEAGDTISWLYVGRAYETQLKAYARDSYNEVLAYAPGTPSFGTTNQHEMLVMIPSASGSATLVSYDGTSLSTANSTANLSTAYKYQRFIAGLASDGTVDVELALLWTGRSVTWSDISSNLATLFASAASPNSLGLLGVG